MIYHKFKLIINMKKLLFIPLLFVCLLSSGQVVDSASIIGKSYRIDNLEVAQNDFPKQMSWEDANKACATLGNGWRLPTKYEYEILHKNKDKISGFTNGSYWSSSEGFYLFAWVQAFLFEDQSTTDGLPTYSTGWAMKYGTYHVRAIRGPKLVEELSKMSLASLINTLSQYLFFITLLIFLIIIIYAKINPTRFRQLLSKLFS
jgi:hypothetical protein